MGRRRARSVPGPGVAATLAMAAVLAGGCGGGKGGEAIAAQIRAADLPYVELVAVSPVNPLGAKYYDDVWVHLTGDVTDAQVQDLWCTVVLPANPDQLSPGAVHLDKGVVFPSAGGEIGGIPVDIPTCPGATPSAPPS